MKRLVSLLAAIAIMMTFCFSVSAYEPTDSFTHVDTPNGAVKAVLSREIYTSAMLIKASDLNLDESFDGINDLFVAKDGKIYILISGCSKIVILNSDYKLDKVVSLVDESGFEVDFTGAQGIFVDDSGIYICNSRKAEILVADHNGVIKEKWGEPDSKLIPEDFYYQPYKIYRDSKGYTYILSVGCYYGALVYSTENVFIGFYGANNVEAGALDMLSYLWNRLTQTDAKKALSVKKLPYSFVDLCFDSKDYMITCTGRTKSDTNGVGQIRKLSPGGADILYKRNTDGTSVNSSVFNFLEEKVVERFGEKKPQNVVAVDVDENGFIYALEQTHGLIYIYDNECNLLGGFGGGSDFSQQLGVFDKANCIAVNGNSLLVGDFDSNTVTVFERTQFGSLLMEAQDKYINGEYVDAMPLWQQVLGLDGGCQLAYRGMAMAYLTLEDYDAALKYAEKGLDYSTYDMAWKRLRNAYISRNFTWIFIIIFVLVSGLISFLSVVKRRKIVLIKNEKVKAFLQVPAHPFRSLEDIKYKNQGSLLIAVVLTVLFYVVNVLKETGSGFLATKTDPKTYNTLYTLLSTAGLIILWSLANWLVASAFAGKGKFKDIFIATTYALLPLIVYTFVRVILSHVLSLTGLAVMDGIQTAVLIFTFFIFSIAIMSVHEYDFFKFLSTSLVSVVFMILIVFVIFLVGVLLQQFGAAFVSIYREIFYR
ncbi:MAG: hypothetical protein IKZ59_04470 [Clostridia bacterium]|nr:hypothetical protein [Clostridia bacterium]